MIDKVKIYMFAQSTSILKYILESILFLLFAWIPTVLGIFLRALFYKAIIPVKGLCIIEEGVKIRRPKEIFLGKNVYIANGVRLYSTPGSTG